MHQTNEIPTWWNIQTSLCTLKQYYVCIYMAVGILSSYQKKDEKLQEF